MEYRFEYTAKSKRLEHVGRITAISTKHAVELLRHRYPGCTYQVNFA